MSFSAAQDQMQKQASEAFTESEGVGILDSNG